MAQESQAEVALRSSGQDEHSSGKSLLGPILCWAVVFADIGTSVYYTPGILYNTEGITTLAGFFVLLTMSVFVLLTLKYAEVTDRFPQGGGVVTVAAQAINHWFGALGGMFILVDYFLTSAISCLSGMTYLGVVFPAITPQPIVLTITIVVLILLGILNWFGISESAKVSLVGAIIAFISDLAILVTVFTHISFSEFIALIPKMFANHSLGPISILIGFAASFLAFSGLESISQLSPVMKTPRKRVAGLALLFVVLTIGITSPLLTILTTLLLPSSVLESPTQSGQVVSLLAGNWGNIVLQTEVAISASALLVFASNTAIIGAYHVLLALSRMDFFPVIVLKRNKLRGTPHYAIALVTAIPIIVLLIVKGNLNILGDLYAFGLLGAFTLTCLGLDIIRYRERKAARILTAQLSNANGTSQSKIMNELHHVAESSQANDRDNGVPSPGGLELENIEMLASPVRDWRTRLREIWYNVNFWLGILTTFLVALAWTTNLIYKPHATLFGGTVAGIGMLVAYINYRQQKQKGYVPVVTTGLEGRLPGSVLAVLTAKNGHNDMVMRSAINSAEGKPVVFLYLGKTRAERIPQIFEVYDPYLYDPQAKETFGKAEHLAQKSKSPRKYVYSTEEPGSVSDAWHIAHPHDTIVAADYADDVADVNPDRIRYELTPEGKVAHLIKRWS
jgi:amino acid transporter